MPTPKVKHRDPAAKALENKIFRPRRIPSAKGYRRVKEKTEAAELVFDTDGKDT